ncbi:cytochrome P450 [Phyllosticta capitalensis]|uniref:Cytochrome P450 n=1 Tax=Phyllosticta capitalensis TaxID=121624 RepID=A0ABR1YAW1_9PEZI
MLLTALLLLVVGLAASFVFRFIQHRLYFRSLPSPPGHSLLFGHITTVLSTLRTLPPAIHPTTYGYHLSQCFKLGRIFYVDFWPFTNPWLIILDPQLGDQIAVRPSLDKWGPLRHSFAPFMGDRHLLLMEGDEWKRWRALFNPGFSAQNMLAHVPAIVGETRRFCRDLAERATRGEVFQMEPLTTNLTVQVIGHVVLGDSMAAQVQGGDYTAILRDQLDLMSQITRSQGLRKYLRRFDPFHWRKIANNTKAMAAIVERMVLNRWHARQQQQEQKPDTDNNDNPKPRTKHVIDLALDAAPSPADTKALSLDPSFLETLTSQTCLFLFAGHDTTSTTLCHALFEISQHPRWCKRLRVEHAAVLGPDPGDAAAEALIARPHLLNEMPVTAAVIKEVLRLYPPAGTMRQSGGGGSLGGWAGLVSGPGVDSSSTSVGGGSWREGDRAVIVDPETGHQYPTAGCMLNMVHFGPHRDPRYFPDPHAFRPERWLRGAGAASPSPSPSDEDDSGEERDPLPPPERSHPHAWRPFEVGPRACIGQELALVEMKVVLALMMRRFDVTACYELAEGSEEKALMKKYRWIGAPAYARYGFTAKVSGGLPVKVVERKGHRDD